MNRPTFDSQPQRLTFCGTSTSAALGLLSCGSHWSSQPERRNRSLTTSDIYTDDHDRARGRGVEIDEPSCPNPASIRRTVMERDVVCGMQVDPAKAAATSEYNGKTYYFCAKACKAKFDANPAQYVKA